MLRVGGQPGVDCLCDQRGALQEVCNCHGILLVLAHAEVQCLEASVGHVAIKWAGHHTHRWGEGEKEGGGGGGGRRE